MSKIKVPRVKGRIRTFTEGTRVLFYFSDRERGIRAGYYSGTVWSHGPVNETRWIIPDDPKIGDPELSGCISAATSGLTIENGSLTRS